MGWTKKQNVLPTYNAFDGSLPRVLYPASAHFIGVFGIFVKCNGSNAMMTSSIARIKWRTKSGNAALIYCIADALQESRWGRRMAVVQTTALNFGDILGMSTCWVVFQALCKQRLCWRFLNDERWTMVITHSVLFIANRKGQRNCCRGRWPIWSSSLCTLWETKNKFVNRNDKMMEKSFCRGSRCKRSGIQSV